MVRAVTFDLWDTLVIDDSDEPARAAAGLLPKDQARRRLFVDEILRHHPLPEPRVVAAFDACNARFRHAWKVEHRTPHVRERLGWALDDLGLPPTPGWEALVEAFATMEVVHPPRPTDGVRECLEALHGRWPLGIVSDAIVTPGVQLRELLRAHDLLRYFDHCVFSDEAGASKPDPLVFRRAAEGLGVPVDGIVHVGDREANDVAGPAAAGARAVLYTGAVDRGAAHTRAAAVCGDLRELPAILERLASEAA